MSIGAPADVRLPLGKSGLTVDLRNGSGGIDRMWVERLSSDDMPAPPPIQWSDVVTALARWPDVTAAGHDWTDHPAFPRRGTSFQRTVWRALCAIAPGETLGYGELARRIGHPGAARAVGQAVGANPWAPLVPCHRVLAGDGSLGGYAGGTEVKAALLALEGIRPEPG
jgi:methylated-DNA-[protein]-cysteine S-methyltransferase